MVPGAPDEAPTPAPHPRAPLTSDGASAGDEVRRRARQNELDGVGVLAAEVFGDLYRAVTGHPADSVRSYCDEDTLLVLLRHASADVADGSFMAMPRIVASAVLQRTGRIITPGNVSSCPERGLLVLAFDVFDEHAVDHTGDPFSLESLWDTPAQAHAPHAA